MTKIYITVKNTQDIVGKTFGRLYVFGYDGRTHCNEHTYTCICECLNETHVLRKQLLKGFSKSCGCLRGDTNRIDLIGKRFGRLVILEQSKRPTNVKNFRAYWLCRCDCGNDAVLASNSLLNGQSLRCGYFCKLGKIK